MGGLIHTTTIQGSMYCTCCLILSLLNERLISNAWDLLQNGPAIVISADKAGSLAGWPVSHRYGRWKWGVCWSWGMGWGADVKLGRGKKKKKKSEEKKENSRVSRVLYSHILFPEQSKTETSSFWLYCVWCALIFSIQYTANKICLTTHESCPPSQKSCVIKHDLTYVEFSLLMVSMEMAAKLVCYGKGRQFYLYNRF